MAKTPQEMTDEELIADVETRDPAQAELARRMFAAYQAMSRMTGPLRVALDSLLYVTAEAIDVEAAAKAAPEKAATFEALRADAKAGTLDLGAEPPDDANAPR